MATVITSEPPGTGFNNQRMVLLGLFSLAKQRGVKASMPSMVDFVPMNTKAERVLMSPWEIFDYETFSSITSNWPITNDKATEELSMHECFKASHQYLVELIERRTVGGAGTTLIKATQPSRGIYVSAAEVATWMRKQNALPVQFRIERDWVRYLKKRGKPTFTADPEYILRKISQTSELDKFDALWACCDEDDLLQSKGELRIISKKYGRRLIFKSDLTLELPESRLQRSAIEFSAATMAEAYVGLSSSTFSRMIFAHAIIGLASKKQFLFDNDGDTLDSVDVDPLHETCDSLEI